jgi:hypothetical protein
MFDVSRVKLEYTSDFLSMKLEYTKSNGIKVNDRGKAYRTYMLILLVRVPLRSNKAIILSSL